MRNLIRSVFQRRRQRQDGFEAAAAALIHEYSADAYAAAHAKVREANGFAEVLYWRAVQKIILREISNPRFVVSPPKQGENNTCIGCLAEQFDGLWWGYTPHSPASCAKCAVKRLRHGRVILDPVMINHSCEQEERLVRRAVWPDRAASEFTAAEEMGKGFTQ